MADSSPRFRHDLIATAVEVDGVRYIDVRDPDRGTGFRFYDFEYALARQLDGRPNADISAWAIATYGLDLTPVGIADFAARLADLGFLEGTTPSVAGAVVARSGTPTLVGAPPPGVVMPAQRPDDESRPLSEVVSRVIEAAPASSSGPASGPTSGPASAPAPAPEAPATPRSSTSTLVGSPPMRRPSSEIPITNRTTVSREATRTEAPLVETVMGFAAVTGVVAKTLPMTVEPDSMGTVMGFAAVTDEQMRSAENAAAGARASSSSSSSSVSSSPSSASGRISSPSAASGRMSATVPSTGERRMPPRPETVVMPPLEHDEARPQPTEPGIRRMVSSVLDRSTILVVVVVALIVIAAVIGYYFWAQREAALEARRVHVITPRPAAVYRWFDAPGSAVVAGTAALAFAAGGSVADVLPPGSHYAAGEVIAKLQGAAAHEAEVNHARSRVAYNQQVRDSMKAAGNLPEMRRAEIKIVEKQAQLDEAEAALDRLVIRATEPGEVSEVIAKRGTLVEANAPAVRVGTGQIRGEFILAAKDAEAAARLGFCRVEIIPVSPSAAEPGAAGTAAADGAAAAANDGSPRFADCRITPSPEPAAPTGQRLEVELPANAGILLGQTLRLARVRYDGVFPVPRSGVVRVGDTDRVFVVGPGNVAQARAITIADSDAEEVVISQGIDVGDRVIIDPPSDLRDGKLLSIQ